MKAAYIDQTGPPENVVFGERPTPTALAGQVSKIKIAKDFGDGTLVLEVPRYQKFSRIMQELAHENISILDIAGGKTIVISASAPNIWYYDLPGILFFTQPLAVDQEHKRIVAAVPVQQLPEVIRKMAAEDVVLEHVYDY